MPERIKRQCLAGGCSNLVESGYCTDHARKTYDWSRGNSNQRGYDARWRIFRANYLRQNPYCVDCMKEAATDVHHILKLADHPELKYERSNLKALCHTCHAIRTGRGE